MVGRVVDVQELLEAGDHVLVALANGMRTCTSGIGADNFVIDNVEIVVHLFRSTIWTVVKSDTAVALFMGYFRLLFLGIITSDFRCRKSGKVRLAETKDKAWKTRLGKLETVSIFVINWIDTSHNS